MDNTTRATVESAISDLQQGKMLILVDDEDRENEGDLIFAAEKVTPEHINFMATHARGLICLPMHSSMLDRLEIPLMVRDNLTKYQTAFTTSIEAATGVSTGISAADRARTIAVAADPESQPTDIITPGHIFPLRARDGGVLVRGGQTEGSVDLMTLAGLTPAAVICEIMNPDGTMARMPELTEFAKQHDIKILTIDDIISHRMNHESLIKEVAASHLPLREQGEFEIKVFENIIDGSQHVVLIKGELKNDEPALVRVHSECLTGDAFGSARCDCGEQLQSALDIIAEQGGVLLYMSQEGRGIGLANKIKAYALQDQGYDTVEANKKLGFSADHRHYGIGSQILLKLGLNKIRLLTNNPGKLYGMNGFGLDIVERVALQTQPTKENIDYLKTKRDKMGHYLQLEEGIK